MMNNPQLNKSIHLLSFNSRSIQVEFRFKPLLPSKLPSAPLKVSLLVKQVRVKKLMVAYHKFSITQFSMGKWTNSSTIFSYMKLLQQKDITINRKQKVDSPYDQNMNMT